MAELASSSVAVTSPARASRYGAALVFLSALLWSLGGAIARYIDAPDPWAVIFWRSLWATAFLIAYMVWRDGWRGTVQMFRDMGLPGLAVAACFATASICFVVALSYTTVANILLIQAGVPLIDPSATSLNIMHWWRIYLNAEKRSRFRKPAPMRQICGREARWRSGLTCIKVAACALG